MTMLMQWLLLGAVVMGPWLAIVTRKFQSPWVETNSTLTLLYPLMLLVAAAVYVVVVLAWRVYNFNDCEEAARELKQHIKEAKEDLSKKGIKFTEAPE